MLRNKNLELRYDFAQRAGIGFTEKRAAWCNSHRRTLLTAPQAFTSYYRDIEIFTGKQSFQLCDQVNAATAGAGTLATAEAPVDANDEPNRT